MRIKVCGITTVLDALDIEEIGVDAIGVVVCSTSKRCVSFELARRIFAALKPDTEKVCVTDTKDPNDIRHIISLKPDTLQLHSHLQISANSGVKLVRAVKPGDNITSEFCDAILVDGSRGRGIAYDTEFAREVMTRSQLPVILAGGLNPENVADAIMDLSPFCVDVSSGVEKSPGIKDLNKVREFVRICREAKV